MLQHAESVSHLAVQPQPAAPGPREPELRERLHALVTRAIGVANEALHLLEEETDDPENQVDDLLRARASLLRVLATPSQIEAEFRDALGRLEHDSELAISLKAHVVELALVADRARPGRLLVPDDIEIDDIGTRRAVKAVR